MNAIAVLRSVRFVREIRNEFEQNYFHPNWQVRRQLITCFDRLMQRKVVTSDFVSTVLRDQFLHTSNGFEMNFLLKEEIRTVFQRERQLEITTQLQELLLTALPMGENRERYINEQLQIIVERAKKGKVVINITEALEQVMKEGS